MAATAVSVAAKLPWKAIIAALPEVVRAAKALGKMWESKPKPDPIDPDESMEVQIAAVCKRVQALEENEREQSDVVARIADQLSGVAAGLKELAARQQRSERHLLIVGILAIAALGTSIYVAIHVLAR